MYHIYIIIYIYYNPQFRCLDFDTAIALIAQSAASEMELTFAATGGAI
jgi:hypothetical protein